MNPVIAFLVLPLYAQRHGGAVREVQTGPALGFVAQLALLTALAGTVGVGGPGWVVGLACGLFTNGLLARADGRYASSPWRAEDSRDHDDADEPGNAHLQPAPE